MLAASGFAGATVGDVADMTVAVGYDEDYADAGAAPTESPGLGFADYLIALGLELTAALVLPGAPTSIREFLPRVGPGAGEHGVAFTYATPVTDVLAWLLETVDGAPYPDLLRDGIWSHIGAEHDANVSLDPGGTAVAGGGLAVTTRDLARFGQFLIDQAATGDDGPVPAAVIESMRAGGDPEAFRRGHYDYLSGYTYRDQWWLPGSATCPLSAWGIHGQLLWVDPDAELVVATHSGGPEPDSEQRDLEQDAAVPGAHRRLRRLARLLTPALPVLGTDMCARRTYPSPERGPRGGRAGWGDCGAGGAMVRAAAGAISRRASASWRSGGSVAASSTARSSTASS